MEHYLTSEAPSIFFPASLPSCPLVVIPVIPFLEIIYFYLIIFSPNNVSPNKVLSFLKLKLNHTNCIYPYFASFVQVHF